ncbi:hypothetical protein BAnh1_02320 [Bartonella australis AUST/NH1]|uniref:Uncharacterized protein n=1 Tax=Bartonella australis (strain Aust/NH1) TaxID=1094489 RepID=M1N2I1_BARAA|nr:hypothetical protein [Bartonella australis]AGF74119.1 hypothetical protein BAnh1_02320 [Bartonella australis AUST/NH1]
MSELVFASEILKKYVAPRSAGGLISERIRYASRRLGWTYSRTSDVWYQDERISLKPRELRQIEEYTGIYYGRKEVREIESLIKIADTLLMGEEENFYRAFLDGLRAFLRTYHSTGTEKRGKR